ncbi:MAG: ABC transporter ATP-binding protein, partial [Candidatus Competibacteraceae bacterium]
ELLLEYSGTLLLVSHDRAFLDSVVTSCLVFEDNGRIGEYVGGYSDWLRQRAAPDPLLPVKVKSAPAPAPKAAKPAAPARLSYKEQRELEQLPERIEQLEQRQQALQAQTADPAFYRQEPAAIARQAEELRALEAELTIAYARWEALDARAGG